MANTIPASQLVNVLPGVVGTGGSALSLNAVMITNSSLIPTGGVTPFSSAADVKALFGADSTQAELAAIYFRGFTGANTQPGTLYFYRYILPEDVPYAWLRSGKNTSTLAELKALTSGDIIIDIDGDTITSATITLSNATSFSNIADKIETALNADVGVAYDALLQAFVFTTTSSGVGSTISFASGSLATALKLTNATGAILSQGAADSTPTATMDAIVEQTQNWATFMTIYDAEPDLDTKLEYANWVNDQNYRYVYVAWDTNINATEPDPDSETFGKYVKTNGFEGVIPVYNDIKLAAFVCGTAASIDFTEQNGRITFAFKGQSGLIPSVTNATIADNLIANGYNFYGAYATATQQFNLFQSGQISGIFKWADSYINQIYLNSQLQQAILNMLTNIKSLPYNNDGYGLLRAACQDPINQALNFGSIRAGIPLSEAQKAEINSEAGRNISGELQTNGWYLQILPASAQTRGNRTSPPMKLWYTDGGSIQQISLASIDVM